MPGLTRVRSNFLWMRLPALLWLFGTLVVCGLGARFAGPASDPVRFKGEAVTGAFQQQWRKADSGSTLSMSPNVWMSVGYNPQFGGASMGAQCGPAEFRRFVEGLAAFESLFQLQKPGGKVWHHPFREVDVDCGAHRYIWLVPRQRPLSPREQALTEYISASWSRLVGTSRMPP